MLRVPCLLKIGVRARASHLHVSVIVSLHASAHLRCCLSGSSQVVSFTVSTVAQKSTLHQPHSAPECASQSLHRRTYFQLPAVLIYTTTPTPCASNQSPANGQCPLNPSSNFSKKRVLGNRKVVDWNSVTKMSSAGVPSPCTRQFSQKKHGRATKLHGVRHSKLPETSHNSRCMRNRPSRTLSTFVNDISLVVKNVFPNPLCC